MIKQLFLKNFKCLRDINIPLGNFNVFVGPNDSGKSSVQEALSILATSTKKTLDKCFLPPKTIDKITTIDNKNESLYLGFCTQDIEYSISLFQQNKKPKVKEEHFKYQKKDIIKREKENDMFRINESSSVGTEPEKTVIYQCKDSVNDPSFRKLEEFLSGIKFCQLKPSELAKDSYLEPTEDNLKNPQLDVYGYGLPSLLSILASTAPDDNRYVNIKKKLKKAIPGISNFGITPVPVQTSKWDSNGRRDADIMVTGQSLYFEIHDKKEHRLPASLMSDGILLILGYLTLIYTTKEISMLFIEEPENGIHPKLLRFIVELLRSISKGIDGMPPVQVIITTHSPYLLDHIEPEEGFIFLKNEDGISNITPMKNVKDIDKWCSEHLLGEVWYNIGEEEMVRKANL